MNNPLMASLGLDSVEADPNALPDGKYPATVFKSEYVNHKAKGAKDGAPKDHVSHVITYKVTEGDRKGAEKQEWFPICKIDEPAAEGEEHVFGAKIVDGKPRVTPTMPETTKPWYKKRLMDLGVPENEVATLNVESLVGLPVVMGIKKNNGFVNISFIELRQTPPEAEQTAASVLGTL